MHLGFTKPINPIQLYSSNCEPNQIKLDQQVNVSLRELEFSMNMTQRRSRGISRLMLVVVLFAQGILAAHACVAPDDYAVQAFAVAASEVEAMPCHTAKKIITNECLMHCTQSDQVNLDHHTMLAAPIADAVLSVATPPLLHKSLTSAHAPVVLNTGPPLSIRFCSFLI